MSALAMTALALAIPTVLGMLGWIALLGRPHGGAAWAACVGSGYVVGGTGFGLLLRLAAPLPITDWPSTIGLPCGLAAGVVAVLLWSRRSRLPPLQAPPAAALDGRSRALLALIAVLLLAHLWTLAVQAIALPTVGWDAWAAWLAKARAWTGAGELLPLADFDAWWASAPGTSRYALAAHYPDALPRLLTWVAAMHGGWHEPAVHAAWPVLWLALLGVLFGYLRLAGAGPLFAAVVTYLVTSLPLLNTHVALAGYADLWLAALLLVVFVHLQRAFAGRSWRDALFAVLAALLLPAVKLEGAIWMLCVLVGALVALVPARWQLRLLPVAAIGLVIGVAAGGVRIPLPGLGVVGLHWGLIEIPTMGRLALYWRPVLPEVLESLFLLPNWHLLWYLLPLAALARMRAGLRLPPSRAALLALASGYGFLFVLFFFTDASAWAESLTSVNRVLLQIVPATIFSVSLLYVPRPAPRGRWA